MKDVKKKHNALALVSLS